MCGRGGVAGDVIMISRRRCTGSAGRRSQQSQESGLQARRPRVERKREKFGAWELRVDSSEHELMPWKRKEGAQKVSGISFKEEGDSEEVWGDSVQVEMTPSVAEKWMNRGKRCSGSNERSKDCPWLQRKCRRTSWSHCNISCKRWKKGGTISCLSTRGCKRGHKRYKASRTRGKYAE